MEFRIKEAREKAGYSQKELAEIIGVAPNTFHGYESGKHDPKSDLLIKIANACHVTTDFLLGTSDSMSPAIKIEKAPSLSDEAMKLATDYDDLDRHGKRMVRLVTDEEMARRDEEERQKQAAILREQREEMEAAEEIAPPITLHQPYAQVAAAEGAGAFLLDDGFDEVLVEMNKYTKQADVILKVVGRSMEPVITDGDRVLVRQQPSVRIGEIGVFIVDGQGYLKEYQADRLVSLNPDIDDVLVGDLQSAECYGKFIKVLNPDWVK